MSSSVDTLPSFCLRLSLGLDGKRERLAFESEEVELDEECRFRSLGILNFSLREEREEGFGLGQGEPWLVVEQEDSASEWAYGMHTRISTMYSSWLWLIPC